jgi:hypothetical protein
MISKVVRDLPFSRNQPLKSADDECIRIFKIQLIKFKKKTSAVAKLVEALRYKPVGRGFDSRWCHWNFSLT